MKKLILLAAVVGFVAGTVSAQQPLTPSLNAYMEAYPLAFGPLASGKAGHGLRSVPLTLDSIRQYIAYPDSVPDFRQVFTYPQANVEVDEQSVFEEGVWKPVNRLTQFSDGLGRVTDLRVEVYDTLTGQYVPGFRTLFYFRGDSPTDLDSLFFLTWVPDIGEYESTLAIRYTYDMLGRIDEAVTTINFFGFIFNQIDSYEYDSEGRLALIESFLMDEAVTIPLSRQEFTYDGDILVSTLTLASDEMGGFVPEERVDYDYTDEGLEDTVITFIWDEFAADWLQISFYDLDYDGLGRIVAETTIDTDEFGAVIRDRIEYEYLDEDNLARYSAYDWNEASQAWQLYGRAYYYYAEITATAEPGATINALHVWPNPTSGLVELQADGEAAWVRVFGLDGSLVMNRQLAAGRQQIDLSGLPAGLYQVHVRSAGLTRVGRVVVR